MTPITDWRTSSFSGGGNNECIEIANTLAAVRDSKNARGGELHVDLRPLVKAVKDAHGIADTVAS